MGKTTQMGLLENYLLEKNLKFKTLKYPIYSLVPTGPRIHAFLKGNNPENLTPTQFQELCAQNRMDFQPELEKMLAENDVVIAEMYTGTGIAYGIGDGVPRDYLLKVNEGLLAPDVSILLDGTRYLESIEKTHVYENDNEKTERIRAIHLDLAKEFGWHVLNANLSRDEIHKEIIDIILD